MKTNEPQRPKPGAGNSRDRDGSGGAQPFGMDTPSGLAARGPAAGDASGQHLEADETDAVLEALRAGLDELDAWVPAAPDLVWFRQQAAEAARRRRTRLYRELALLWCLALLVLSVLYVTATRQPAAFLWVQAGAVLVPLVGLWLNKREVPHDERI